MSLRHTELQKYLKTLQKAKKIHLGLIPNQKNRSKTKIIREPRADSTNIKNFSSIRNFKENSNYSFEDYSQVNSSTKIRLNLTSEIEDQDDIYLIHPQKILKESNVTSPRKKRRYCSVSNISPEKELGLKIEPK